MIVQNENNKPSSSIETIVPCGYPKMNENGVQEFCTIPILKGLSYCRVHYRRLHCSGVNSIKNCDVKLTDENRGDNGRKCKDCLSILQKITEEKIVEVPLFKVCKACENELPSSKFSAGHLKCNKCSYSKLTKLPKETVIEMYKNTSKMCIECKITKEITAYTINGNNYRNQCRECISAEIKRKRKLKKI